MVEIATPLKGFAMTIDIRLAMMIIKIASVWVCPLTAYTDSYRTSADAMNTTAEQRETKADGISADQ